MSGTMPALPLEIIADILSRLPVKPLLQFRCVSKPFCALIDHPNFIKMHLSRSIQARTNLSLILPHPLESRLYSQEFDSLEKPVELDHPLKSEQLDEVQVWGSCNGLLCLANIQREGDDVVLWNPSTKRHWKLPVPQIETAPPPPFSRICRSVVYGFGFDSLSDDYKVVRIVQYRGSNFVKSEVRVCSLKSNSWKRVQDFPYYLPSGCEPGVLACGALHWVVEVNSEVDEDEHTVAVAIVSFDLGTERYQVVPQPEYEDTHFVLRVGILDGSLCVLCRSDEVGVDIWLMKEYGVKASWTKVMSIKHPDQIIPDRLRLKAYSKDSGRVFLQHGLGRFFWYDIKRETLEKANSHDMPDFLDAHVCLGSLVPLAGGSGSDGKKQPAREKMKVIFSLWFCGQFPLGGVQAGAAED